jgi:hypothetical protein
MADEAGGSPRRPEKVSKDELANEIVELLRQAARKIIELGDKCARAEADALSERQRATMYEEDWHHNADAREEHAAWADLLADFRSGIRDREELLEATVGR